MLRVHSRWKQLLTISIWAGLLGLPTFTWAHSDLDPRQSLANKWETYTLTVPTETEVPTIEVRLMIPSEFEVETLEYHQAWQTTTTRDTQGHIRQIIWSGSQIPPQTFSQFKLLVRNPRVPGTYRWQIEQAYAGLETATWEAQTHIITAESAESQRLDEAWRAAQVATTVSLVAIGIAIVLILVTIVGIVQHRREPSRDT